MAGAAAATKAQPRRTRVLFVAEAVTLAHVARPAALASVLEPQRYDLHFAHCPRYRALLGKLPATEHSIDSIEPAAFNAALARGAPLYDFRTLKAYVEADLALLESVRPDLVVGDFRLSLAVSARRAGVPFVNLSNACWSPFVRQRYPVPDLPLSRALGPALAQPLFSVARPLAFASHCLPMRRLCRHFGLPSPGFDLAEVYTAADYTLYADLPGLYDMAQLPAGHRFIGPVCTAAACAPPPWWDALPADKPLVYVTPGSSGSATILPSVLQALAGFEGVAAVATAGAELPQQPPDNVYSAPYLPGDAAAARASLVICNGGSPTTHQALACAVPVLGIAGNLDQHLNMQTLERAGVGMRLRSDSLTVDRVVDAVRSLMSEPSFRDAARGVAADMARWRGADRFRHFLQEADLPWSVAREQSGELSSCVK